ncbi:MAG: lysophospholipid acyltransferase family protein [Nocardioides sp.]|uniref:lysophospholipid acyltransferase family protein n=1 Tax=Nocardioides sp. TaxID=35761 RepID=UPI003D6BC657
MSTSPLAGTPRTDLPNLDGVEHPARWALQHISPFARWVIRRRYDVRLHETANIPVSGPIIFASNHVGIIDGPLLAIFTPRQVHALTKSEMFDHWFLGPFLCWAGQIPLFRVRSDPTAVKLALRTLREGNAMGIYPEGHRGAGDLVRFNRGAAYFALVSGAPVVPVTMVGSRDPGGGLSSIPHAGARIDIVYGEPFHVERVGWPRTREQVGHVSGLLQKHMQVQQDHALALTGRELPGPLPSEENDD